MNPDTLSGNRNKSTVLQLFQFRILPMKILPIRIDRQCFENSLDGNAHPANARLTIHLFRVNGDTIIIGYGQLHFNLQASVVPDLMAIALLISFPSSSLGTTMTAKLQLCVVR